MKKVWKKIAGMVLAAAMVLGIFGSQAVTALADVTWPAGPEVSAPAAIVMDAASGTILYEKNADEQHYPASITKIMTVLVALENANLDDVITFSQEAIDNTYGSGIARDYGEEMTLEQCLYGIMLESSNECAYAVAEYVGGGDYQKFIDMMNEKAAELGCTNTHFSNCNGLHMDDHVTTCHDMALISRAAIQNDDFRTICGTRRYTIPPTNKHSEETLLNNHHQMFSNYKGSQYLYDYCIGGKTGWTEQANNTLVSYAEKDGVTLVCVVMNCATGDQYTSTETLFDYCFDNFKHYNVSENETRYENEGDENTNPLFEQGEAFAQVDPDAEVILPVTADFNDTTTEVSYDNVGGDVLGTLVYTYGDRVVGEADIVTTGVEVQGYDFGKKDGILSGDLDLKNDDGSRMTIPEILKAKFLDENGRFTLKNMDLQMALILLILAAIVVIIIVILTLIIGKARRAMHRRNPYEKQYKRIRNNRRWNRRG